MTSSATVDHSPDPAVDPSEPVSHKSEQFQTPSTESGTASPDDKSQKVNAGPLGGNSGSEPVAAHRERNPGSTLEGVDEFGLPIRVRARPVRSSESSDNEEFHDVKEADSGPDRAGRPNEQESNAVVEGLESEAPQEGTKSVERDKNEKSGMQPSAVASETRSDEPPQEKDSHVPLGNEKHATSSGSLPDDKDGAPPPPYTEKPAVESSTAATQSDALHQKRSSLKASEWSHQRLNESKGPEDESESESDGGWQDMPAIDEFDVYDDFGRLVARGTIPEDNEAVYKGLGGAGKGYTRVQLDEDAQSATSLDEDTSYLFREATHNSAGVEGEELRDAVSQLQATKDLLTESQRIAYVGVARLAIFEMTKDLDRIPSTKGTRKAKQKSIDSMRKWGQTMMARVYAHMDIDTAEQIMIEQLAEHGVQPADLVRPLMQNARVKNPLVEDVDTPKHAVSSPTSPSPKGDYRSSLSSEFDGSASPPPYETHEGEDLPEVRTPSQLPTSRKIDIDLRWTVLCDLFLVLIADSTYDARSRSLLEKVGKSMEVSWLQIARFEKRVVDALEMQEEAEKETWDESDHMEKRRKMALKRKFMVMGLATVGGGLVIGLSAGLLAPVIGAGLAAGFTTVGISGTSAFLGGVGGTALIASSGTLTGGTIGLRASDRRTGAVQTFEYRPLHNNKRVNLIVTVSGWMTGKVDDVRLPFSTVDPIMGDLYSVLWEPEMLRSMGDTINILATEALTQGLQQILGSTVLVALMASLQLPLVLTKLSYLIDNPWIVSLARANAAGLILADSLMDRNLGKRPITLMGFSLGSRLIFSCLKELADRGAHGLVQNVYLFGSPIVANKDEYLKARSVVSGRFVNGYSSNDWILGYLFRATSGGIMRVAGLAPVEEISGLENFDVTKLVNGHMDYRAAMPRLLKEVGWEVLSEEFAELEDPDPENHAERQRELIREIDEARREAEARSEKKRFGLFKRGKLAQKKGWETYDVERNNATPRDSNDSNGTGSVLFDIDAIRAELASESIEVKQLESTLPPMKLDLNSPSSSAPATPTPSDSKDTAKAAALDKSASQSPPEPYAAPLASHHQHSSIAKEEEIEMTFDTFYHESPQRSHSFYEPTPITSYNAHSARPELRPSLTMPAGVGIGAAAGVGASALGALALEPNAWADHDIGDGEEGEIQMSFE
ncbi:hypothetical protein BDV28DRAFT_51701 [Aspergillus coremiiformis]|uniref:DUF726-domain-containing protein n=1 Tax=Aspergillus coremiiformis TaxID=138285 RepID=A0A5N6YZ03_9EURO|nr:hypothetical protein BDV28DRAFT_51701 [Aspergillus coremiiformis]